MSMAFGIEATRILSAGAIDVSLNCDTNLFIDPLLLPDSSDRDFAACAGDVYKQRFERLSSCWDNRPRRATMRGGTPRDFLSSRKSDTHTWVIRVAAEVLDQALRLERH